MNRKMLITAISFALLLMGCASKEATIDVNDKHNGMSVINDTQQGQGNVEQYRENVDFYGGENMDYTNSSSYGASEGGVKNIYFDVDQYIITADKLFIVRNNAKLLRGTKVKIEGHCDATGTDEYNYALGLRRARAAKEAMVSSGAHSSDITMVSMGESTPECTTGYSSECYAKNRRVEFKVIR